MAFRRPTVEERSLLAKLWKLAGNVDYSPLDEIWVEIMSDVGMGSLRLSSDVLSTADRKLGRQISALSFSDADGVEVSAVLNVDQFDKLYELDVWKVDFSPLQKWPKF